MNLMTLRYVSNERTTGWIASLRTSWPIVVLTRLVGTAAQFLLVVLVARNASAEDAAIFFSYIAIYPLVGMVGSLGFPELLLKLSALDHAQHTRQHAAMLSKALPVVMPVALLTSALATIPVLAATTDGASEAMLAGLTLSTVVSCFTYSIARLRMESWKGQGHLGRALTWEFLLPPLGPIVVVVVGVIGAPVAATSLIIAHGTPFICLLILAGSRVHLRLPPLALSPRVIIAQAIDKMGNLGPLWLIGMMSVLLSSLPMLMAPFLLTPYDVVILAVALRLIGFANTMAATVGSYYSGAIVRHTSAPSSVYILFQKVRMTSAIISLVVLIPVAIAPSMALAVFGTQDAGPTTVAALMVMLSGRLVVVIFGLPEYFNKYSRRNVLQTLLVLISIVFQSSSIILLFLWIGFIGFAIAIQITSIFYYGLSWAICDARRDRRAR